MTFSRSPGDACSPIFIPPPLTFSHLAEFRAAFELRDRAGLLESTRAATAHAGRPSPGIGDPHDRRRCFPRLIEAKCEVETCQTLRALQTVKTGREFLSRRGAPLSSARWGLRRFSGEL